MAHCLQDGIVKLDWSRNHQRRVLRLGRHVGLLIFDFLFLNWCGGRKVANLLSEGRADVVNVDLLLGCAFDRKGRIKLKQ